MAGLKRAVRIGAASSTDSNPEMESLVELQNIHKTYLLGVEGVPALRGVSLNIYKGEWIIIFGTSGGGKTSLLNIIGTIDKPTKGELKISGSSINSKTDDDFLAEIRLAKLGFVFQSFNLLSNMTAIENVELPMILKGDLPSSKRKEKARNLLNKVGMGHRESHFPNQMSGGEQQRVTIARSIANDPDILLLDEPTGDLDTVNSFKILKLLYDLNTDKQMTMIMVTHDVYLKNFAHRVIYMRDGKISKIDTVPTETRETAYKELLFKINTIKKLVDTTNIKESDTSYKGTNTGIFSNGVMTELRYPKDYEVLGLGNDNDNIRETPAL